MRRYLPKLDNGSRMSGDVHVRFCEGLGVKFLRSTLPKFSDRMNENLVELLLIYHGAQLLDPSELAGDVD